MAEKIVDFVGEDTAAEALAAGGDADAIMEGVMANVDEGESMELFTMVSACDPDKPDLGDGPSVSYDAVDPEIGG